MLTREMLVGAQREIERRITRRLEDEDGRLPGSALASGQYLDHPDFEQRGLYGTAAAIRVLATKTTTEREISRQVSRLFYYIVNRSQVEKVVVAPTLYRDLVTRRIRLQKTDIFRMADVGFSASFVSPAVPLRAETLNLVQRALSEGQLSSRGYAVGAEGGEINPLATAHALRCLAANNLPTRAEDWQVLRDYVVDGRDIYIRSFIVYVLTDFDPKADRTLLRNQWKNIFSVLTPEFSRHSEANHEYTRYGAQDYVRIPWQVYLIQAAARLFPLSRFNSFRLQNKLVDIVRQITTTAGFRYESSGSYLSTRTYSCIWQVLDEILQYNLSDTLPHIAVRAVETTTRVLSGRVFSSVLYTLAAVVAIGSLILWWQSPTRSLGDLAPNLLTELVLIVFIRASVQIKRARH